MREAGGRFGRMESVEEVLLASSLQNTHVNEIVEVANLEVLEDALFIQSVHLDHVLYALVATQVDISRRLPTNLHAGLAAVRRSGASLSLFSNCGAPRSSSLPPRESRSPGLSPQVEHKARPLFAKAAKSTSETPEKRK